ncbi:MAG: DUF3179 domain-containing protein, partial [Bacteroidetes bacterium]|nr:DUF3179 domain-containing protein [Bacteroidota bacterium]
DDSAGVTPTFERKSWVIGIKIGDKAKAYDWADLIHQLVINDTFENTKIVIVLEEDTFSYHVWNARVGHNNLSFRLDTTNYKLYDMSTGSEWNMSGRCISGELQDQQLRTILAHQEYWFSWKTFHPNTLRWHAN